MNLESFSRDVLVNVIADQYLDLKDCISLSGVSREVRSKLSCLPSLIFFREWWAYKIMWGVKTLCHDAIVSDNVKVVEWLLKSRRIRFRTALQSFSCLHQPKQRVSQYFSQFIKRVNSVPFFKWDLNEICPHPKILVVGPRKSGKTSLIHSLLNFFNTPIVNTNFDDFLKYRRYDETETVTVVMDEYRSDSTVYRAMLFNGRCWRLNLIVSVQHCDVLSPSELYSFDYVVFMKQSSLDRDRLELNTVFETQEKLNSAVSE